MDGLVFESFQDATEALGLCDSDEHHHIALQDVFSIVSAARARRFLVTVLVCYDVAKPLDLWSSFQADLCEDLLCDLATDVVAQAALRDMQMYCQAHGRSLAQLGLPSPADFDVEARKQRELRAELEFNVRAERVATLSMRKRMYAQQAAAFNRLKYEFTNKENAVFFVDGPGGSAKSFLGLPAVRMRTW